jgi:hypothetical protein
MKLHPGDIAAYGLLPQQPLKEVLLLLLCGALPIFAFESRTMQCPFGTIQKRSENWICPTLMYVCMYVALMMMKLPGGFLGWLTLQQSLLLLSSRTDCCFQSLACQGLRMQRRHSAERQVRSS